MSIPSPTHGQVEAWIHETVNNERQHEHYAAPFPPFAKNVEEATALRLRADAILEEFRFRDSNESIPDKDIGLTKLFENFQLINFEFLDDE